MMNYYKKALEIHKKLRGKIEIASKITLDGMDDLSIAYTPGVAAPTRKIAEDREAAYTYTGKGNTVAVVTDGSAVLGLGDVGSEAALPVMEGKAVLFKELAEIDALPICLDTKNTDEIIATIRNIAPGLGGINLEDIAAPRCFAIEDALQDLPIPVFHDDQHGTAIVVLAALINALEVTDRDFSNTRVVVSGAGAAGIAITKLLQEMQIADITLIDSGGVVSTVRDDINSYKREVAELIGSNKQGGTLAEELEGADVFIGVSAPGILRKEVVGAMKDDPIIFALANPDPEIDPKDAQDAGATVVATGRSDFPNQVNNVLAFPGIFAGALNARADRITEAMKIAAAEALAGVVDDPQPEKIIPSPLSRDAVAAVRKAVENTWKRGR